MLHSAVHLKSGKNKRKAVFVVIGKIRLFLLLVCIVVDVGVVLLILYLSFNIILYAIIISTIIYNLVNYAIKRVNEIHPKQTIMGMVIKKVCKTVGYYSPEVIVIKIETDNNQDLTLLSNTLSSVYFYRKKTFELAKSLKICKKYKFKYFLDKKGNKCLISADLLE